MMTIRRKAIGVAAVVLTMVGGPAFAKPLDRKQAPAEKLVCQYRVRTGTRFATKVCRTTAELEAMAEGSRRAMKEMADRPFIYDCRTSGQPC